MESSNVIKLKKPKLTKKQRGFVNDYVLEENGTKAALKNYDINGKDPINIANQIAIENLQKPTIIEAIEQKQISLKEALKNRGIDEAKIAEKIEVLLNAEDYESGKKDYTAIDKGLKHATNIYGVQTEPPKSGVNVTYNFLFSKETQDKIKIINQELKDKLIGNNE